METRVGTGYDVHAFAEGSSVWLGGIRAAQLALARRLVEVLEVARHVGERQEEVGQELERVVPAIVNTGAHTWPRLKHNLRMLRRTTTAEAVLAERAMNRRLEGGCQVPIACYAERANGEIWLRGMVGDPDGKTLLTAEARGPEGEPEQLGVTVAEDLLRQGAQAILDAVYREADGQ